MVASFWTFSSNMAAAKENFVDWLGNKLKDLNTDENVFGLYITSILDSDETSEEKTEALQGILSEIVETENELTVVCNEIMNMWNTYKLKEPTPSTHSVEDVDVKLAKLLESQCLAITKQKQYTEEEKKIREAILSQYSQMTDDENEDAEVSTVGDRQKQNGLEKNTNVYSVQQAEKEKREQARVESQRKKEKDKEDREKQKQMREEKKEKRKTQKGERRR